MGLLVYGLWIIPSQATMVDYLVYTIYCATACKCLLSSAIFHTFCAHHHHQIYVNVSILDYCGISSLIFGSFTISLYYSLYCHENYRMLYFGIIGVLCGSGVVLPWFNFFRHIQFRIWRTLYFVAMVAVSTFICAHSIYLVGLNNLTKLVQLEYFALELGIYLLGAWFYASKYPEKLFPGKLDVWFHSHQLWHVLILFAAVYHYKGSLEIMVNRLTMDTCSM